MECEEQFDFFFILNVTEMVSRLNSNQKEHVLIWFEGKFRNVSDQPMGLID